MPTLELTLHGPLQIRWGDQAVPLRSLKARCLLVALALEARPMRREELAELLWGPGRLRNLRQAVYQLRQLPGSELWLEVRDEHLQVSALITPAGPPSATANTPPFCEELLGTTVAMDDLLARHELRLESADRQRQLQSLRPRLARVLAVCEPPLPVLAEVLGCSPAELGALLESELPQPEPTALEAAAIRAQVAAAWESLDPAAAAGLWTQAGQGDRAALAWERAGALDRAAQAADSLPLKRRLALAWAEADPDAGQAWLQGLALRSQDPQTVCLAALGRAKACLSRGEVEEGLDAAQEAWHAAQDHALSELIVLTRPMLGHALYLTGELAAARPHLEAALSSQDPWAQRIGHAGLGAISGMRGELEAAVAHHRQALRLGREQRELLAAAASLNNLGGDLERLGRHHAAAARFAEATALFVELERPDWEVLTRCNQAHCLMVTGQLGQARVQASTALNLALELDHSARIGHAWDTRGELERACGRWEEAAEAFARAAAAHLRGSRRPKALRARFNQACSLLEGGAGSLDEALEALAALAEVGEPAVVAQATLELALWVADPAQVASLLARLPQELDTQQQELRALVRVRAGMERRSSLVEGMCRRACPEQALACAVLAGIDSGGPWGSLRDQALASLGEGLLSTQRSALAERVERLLALRSA